MKQDLRRSTSSPTSLKVNKILTTIDADLIKSLQATLSVVCPRINSVMEEIGDLLNLLPPSGAMAGAYTMCDKLG